MATGRADMVDQTLLERAGVQASTDHLPAGYSLGHAPSAELPREERVHMPERVGMAAGNATWVGYEVGDSPTLTRRDGFLYWQPPDLADPTDALVPHSQIGTVSPYVQAARAMLDGAAAAAGIRLEPPPPNEPVTFHCWSSAGAVHVLLGNLESGWMGDSRFPRRVTVVLPRSRVGLDPAKRYLLNPDDGSPAIAALDPESADLRFAVEVPSQGCVHAVVVEA